METKKIRKAVLAMLVAFALCEPVWAEPVSRTYVFIPDQSTVVQTGGIADINETHTISGMFWLTVDFDANTAFFSEVDANLSESIYLPTQSLGELFEMLDLNSTEANETAIKFEDDNPPLGGIEIDITVTFVDDSLHLTGGRVEPWIDGFGYGLDAVAVRQPVIYYVDIDATGANNGSSWADAYNSLPEALGDANSAGKPVEIRVAQGTYRPTDGVVEIPELDERMLSFQLINGVVIKGGYAGFGEPDPNARDIDAYKTILSGDLAGNDVDVNDPCDLLLEPTRAENSYHVVSGAGTDANAVFDGFTITGGNANGSWMEDNVGGGMYNLFGSPTVTNCTFRGNSADYYGGGMYNGYDVGPLITNCEFSNNCVSDHGRGGGIFNDESDPSLTHCVFIDNEGGDAGGGVCNYNCSGVFTDCVFVGNSVPVMLLTGGGGGAVYNSVGAPKFANCIFAGNWAGWGGAISNVGSVPEVTNCTFAANPGAIVNWMDDCHPKLRNCILWNGGNEVLNKIGATITITYSNVQGGYPGQGNINADPLFVDGNGDDFHLIVGSPCIDTGDPNYIAEPNETDLDGNPRIVNGIVDMGAYEFQGLLYVDDDAPNDPGPGDPGVSDPLENGSEAHPFDEIQEAIDVAQDSYTVLVLPGLYLDPDPEVWESIYFLGKNIKLTGSDPADPNIVKNTVIAGSVLFNGTEDTNCTLTGFSIRNLGNGAIYGNHTHATISYCILSGNGPCGATVIENCDGTISNCLITDNITVCLSGIYPVILGCHGLIKNCTIANNWSGVGVLDGGTTTMQNCIIYYNGDPNEIEPQVSVGSGGTLNISYCDVQGGLEGIFNIGDVNWGLGNIDADPCFFRLGYWNYEPWPCELTEGDYHLKSQGWRWSEHVVHDSHWFYDFVTSRCIDAGNPGSPLRDELLTVLPEDPNNDWGINLRINMGAYGGTAIASMGPPGWALLGDLTNDGIVDWRDLGGQVEDWLSNGDEWPGDLDRNGIVNSVDYGLLAQDWRVKTTWYEPYIVLKIYSDGWGTLLDTIIMSQEGEITISIEEENPYYDPPLYYIYAFREGHYTELYNCEKGETINVDLDPIVPGMANGVIFMTLQWFPDCYLSLTDVTVKEGDTIITQFQTDDQGRFAIDVEPGNYYFEFTFDFEVYSEEVEIQGQYQDFFFPAPMMVLKPNIYLYPEETIELDVEILFPHGGQITTAIPDYGDGWHITVEPSGIIDGQYEWLFYESVQPDYGQYDAGWVVAGEELEDFFRSNMAQTGFNQKEIDDFIDYWIPLLIDYPYYAIYPQYNEELEEIIQLEFSIQPQSLIRLIYSVRGLEDNNFNIQEPVIPPFAREGFTVAEWGVILK